MLNIYNFYVCKYGDGLSILSYYGENNEKADQKNYEFPFLERGSPWHE